MAIPPPPDAAWRDSARAAKLFFLDAVSVFPFLLWALHIRWWTFILAALSAVFLTVLNHFGFSIPVFLRWLRSTLAGKRKLAIPWWI